MTHVMIDTAAWIEAIKGRDAAIEEAVGTLLQQSRAAICGVIELELLHGLNAKTRRSVIPLLTQVRFFDATRLDWRAAETMLRDLKMKGHNVPVTDALIAAVCVQNHMMLLSPDKHFHVFPDLVRYRAG